MNYIRVLFYVKAIALSIGSLNSNIALYACVLSYISYGHHITPEKAFIVTGCFATLSSIVTQQMPVGISLLAELKASFIRINDFLNLEEATHNHSKQSEASGDNHKAAHHPSITLENATVRSFRSLNIIQKASLSLASHGLTTICGFTGSGKSALLKLILGDANLSQGSVRVQGTTSYSSQDPWIFPSTVRQNILFGEKFDSNRYSAVVKACCLEPDFVQFPCGDETKINDTALNLSRGQKVRIGLARAVYKKADVYLLDDSLTAVDSRVSAHIIKECIQKFLKHKMCVIVTHNRELIKNSHKIIFITEGVIECFENNEANQEKTNSLLSALASANSPSLNTMETTAEESEEESENPIVLIQDKEEVFSLYKETHQEGKVNCRVYLNYFKSGESLILVLAIGVLVITQVLTSWSAYFVGYW